MRKLVTLVIAINIQCDKRGSVIGFLYSKICCDKIPLDQSNIGCIALPDATPEELYFRLHEDPAQEIARERSTPLVVVGDFRREATVGAILGTDSVAAQGAFRRKR